MEFRNPGHVPDRNPGAAPSPAAHPTAAHPPAAHTTPAHKKTDFYKNPKQLILWLIVLILFISAIGIAAYYVKRYNDSQDQIKKLAASKSQSAQSQDQQVIAKIGLLTPLPAGEKPTVATVTDITKLKDQPFFANAQNGDKVLIYTQAKKAYLYRPSTNKLINIAPVNLGSQTGTTTTPTTAPKTTTPTTKKTP